MPEKKRLTKSSVAALQPRDKIRIVWDSSIAGLGVRVMPSGIRTYFLQRRTKSGRAVKITIGRCDRVTAEQARDKARELVAQIDLGRDPAAELEAKRAAEQSRRQAPTVAELAERYLREHAVPKKRPASVAGDRTLLRRHVLPTLGRCRVATLTRAQVETLHREVTAAGAPYAANRVLALVNTMLNLAVAWGWRADNPASRVQRNPEDKRERYLRPDELARLLAVLERRGDRAATCLEFLLLTGARRGEVLGMRWRDLDFASGTWTKPAGGTKQKRSHRLPLNVPALRLLADLPRGADHERVFAGLAEHHLRRAWSAVCREAGLDGVRLHDLRHAHASLLVNAGVPIALVGGLLGHSSQATTSRYSHLYDDPQRVAAAKVGDLLEALRRGEGGEVVPLSKPAVS